MNSQDKLFEDFRAAAKADEERDFSAQEKLWARIETQLDKKDTKPKRLAWRNVMYVAASLVVLLGLSLTWYFMSNEQVPFQNTITQTTNETSNPIAPTETSNFINNTNIVNETITSPSKQNKKIVVKQTKVNTTTQKAVPTLALPESKPNESLQLIAKEDNSVERPIISEPTVVAVEMRSISGIVMDKNGPIAGAAISVKGSNQTVQADEKGNFSIAIPVDKTELIVSSFGAETKAVHVNEKESYMVQLEPDYNGADVFGAIVSGKRSGRRNQTKSLNTLAPQGISNKTTNSITEILERTTPGILPSKGNMLPSLASENAMMRQSPIYSNDPLIVVNGAPFSGKFSEINAKDIEKIDILNEAAGRAVFGARAKNGVIQVTLKQGKSIEDFKQIKSAKKK